MSLGFLIRPGLFTGFVLCYSRNYRFYFVVLELHYIGGELCLFLLQNRIPLHIGIVPGIYLLCPSTTMASLVDSFE